MRLEVIDRRLRQEDVVAPPVCRDRVRVDPFFSAAGFQPGPSGAFNSAASGPDKELPVEYDEHAECYVQQEECPDCGSLFELYVGIE